MVSWTAEQTPVSGTLDKMPDVDNVCEGSEVSTTLNAGSGGNGSDSLVYRTHNGAAWSAWANYTSGNNISTTGKIQVEILTLRKADYCDDASTEMVSWTVEKTPVSGTPDKMPNVDNVCEGDEVSATLNAGSGGNGSDSLVYRTYNGTSWSAWTNYTSGNNISTTGKIQVEILTLRKADYCDDASTEMVSWTAEQTPVSGTLDKMPDVDNVCEGSEVSTTLNAGSGGNGSDSLVYRTHNGAAWSAWTNYTSGNNISTTGKIQVEILTLRKADYCDDASTEMVSWTAEQTPVSGTLDKMPDVDNVCEGSEVSTTLNAGSGGNGSDSLVYRTHNGAAWSAWANYTSGNNISTTGKIQVEILTLRKADYCDDASTEMVSWTAEQTPVSGTLDKMPDVDNVCEGSEVSTTLNAGSGGNGSDSLVYRTYNGTSWSAWTNYTSGNNISTTGKIQIEIQTIRQGTYCNDDDAETVSWNTYLEPIAFAGNDASVLPDEVYTLSEATAENYTSINWSTSGDGSFDNKTAIKPTYTPCTNDITAGGVVLTISLEGLGTCNFTDADTMTLTIYRPPTVEITSPSKNESVYDTTLTITGTASDPDNDLSEIYIRLNDGSWQLATGTTNWSFDLPLTFGNKKIEAKAVDAQSLESEIDEVTIFAGVQMITLYDHWSHFSAFLDPITGEVETIMEYPVSQNLLNIMVNNSGGIFWPQQNINTMGNWMPGAAYKICIDEQSEILFKGDLLNEASIQLGAGPRYLPVLSNVEVPVDEAFENPEEDILVMFNHFTNEIYWPGGGIFTLQTLTPGHGYLANLINPAMVTFPDYDLWASGTKTEVHVFVHNSPWPVTKTGEVHQISLFTEAFDGMDNYSHIGAFDSQDNCIGCANITDKGSNVLLTVYGDDIYTSFKDGAEDGEFISFRAYDPINEKEIGIEPTFSNSFPNNDGLFAMNGLSAIVGFKESSTGIGESNLSSQISVYPNPAKDELNIIFKNFKSDNEIHIEIINSSGNTVLKKDILQKHTKLDIQNIQPGMYVLKIIQNGEYSFRKLVIQ